MYDVYINKTLMPVSPSKVTFKSKNMNKAFNLVDGGEVNIPKFEGLKTVEMSLMFPSQRYPFAKYRAMFEPPINFIEKLENLKQEKKIFQLVITREISSNSLELGLNDFSSTSFDTNLTVTLEEFTVKEDSEYGNDIFVDLVFKEYKEISKKVLKVIDNKELSKNVKNGKEAQQFINRFNSNKQMAFIKQKRPISVEMKTGNIKVDSDTLLWQVVRKFQGNTKALNKVMSDNKIMSYAEKLNRIIQIDKIVK